MKSQEIEDIYPLSPMQEGLLFQSLYAPDSSAYFEQLSFHISGELDLKAFVNSWKLLGRRHAVLRAAFVHKNHPRPLQVVFRERDMPVLVRKLDDLPELDQQQEIEAYLKEDMEKGFDLTHDPLMRIAVFHLRDDSHHVIWSHHHILTDGWCLGILYRELTDIYKHLCRKEPPDFLNNFRTPPPYRRYIEWLGRQDSGDSESYWKQYLSGYEQLASVPADRPIPEDIPGQFEEFLFTMGEEVSGSLKKLAARYEVTLYTVFQSLWGILLSRYNNTDDVVFGAIVSGRPSSLEGVEEMVGLFINAIPVRIRTSPDQPFSNLLKTVQEDSLEGEPHHHVPLAVVQAGCPRLRTLFDHLLSFENYPLDQELIRTGGFSVDDIKAYEHTHYNFNLIIFPEEDIRIRFSYNGNAYTRAQAERFASHLRTAAASILEHPEVPASRIRILPEAERKKVLYEFNDTAADYPKDKTISDLFEAQAAKNSDAPAVIFEDVRLTYHELNRRANSLAQYLRETCGIRPDDLVAVMLDRTEQVIAVFLGILKAGGAYVPIDPGYPRDRIGYILKDSGCRVLLTESKYEALVSELSAEIGADQMTVTDIHSLPAGDIPNLPGVCNPDHAAYVIYTSGSTGLPKGCVITHRNVVRLMKNDKFCFDFGEDDVWVVAHSFCFDFSVWEMYGAILYGGKVVVATQEDTRDPDAFLKLIRKHRITVLNQTPAAFYNLIEAEMTQESHDLDQHLRYVIFGGDKLNPGYLRPWAEVYSLEKIRLVNMYGITETTVHVTFGPLSRKHIFEDRGRSPVGVPLPETQVYVCDGHKNFQPIGVRGELYVGGTGVSRGYLNREELTSERFVPNPFKSDEILYRAGDVGRWLEDGTLEFFGRNDDQVQVRGYRVEPAEIEACLAAHESVEKAVVIARDGVKELTAYVTTPNQTADQFNVNMLRDHLRKTLPDYMIPSYFVRLDEFPLTSNKKVDRRSLPDPKTLRPQMEADYVMPQTDAEERIATIWQEALGVEKVGTQDNFFDLGGHSLLMVRIRNKLKEVFEREISIVELFKYPTIHSLAGHLTGQGDEADSFRQGHDRAESRAARQNSRKEQRKSRLIHRRSA